MNEQSKSVSSNDQSERSGSPNNVQMVFPAEGSELYDRS